MMSEACKRFDRTRIRKPPMAVDMAEFVQDLETVTGKPAAEAIGPFMGEVRAMFPPWREQYIPRGLTTPRWRYNYRSEMELARWYLDYLIAQKRLAHAVRWRMGLEETPPPASRPARRDDSPAALTQDWKAETGFTPAPADAYWDGE